jgi:hypothetical protein
MVQVSIGHPAAFVHHYGDDVLLPLGYITSVSSATEGRYVIRLLVRGSPSIVLDDARFLNLIFSRSELDSLHLQSHRDLPEIMKGDTVLVKDVSRSDEILTSLQREGVDISHSRLSTNQLVGLVTARVSAHVYRVHFGSYHSGVVELTTSDLARLRAGPKTIAKKRLHQAQLTTHLFTPEELILLDEADLEGNADVLVRDWRDTLIKEQRLEESSRIVIDYLYDGSVSSVFKNTSPEALSRISTAYRLQNDVLYHFDRERWMIVVPKALRQKILQLAHNDLQHFGSDRTFNFINQYFYWKGMAEQTRRYVASCLPCQKRRNFQFHTDHYGVDIAERIAYAIPGKYWAIDLHKMDKDDWGNTQLLVMVDLHSRFVITVALPNKEQGTVITAVLQSLST